MTWAGTYTLAYRLTGNEEDALDVTQEAYLRALRGLPRFRGEARFSTWLYRVTANCASNHLARSWRSRHDQLDPDGMDEASVRDRRPEHDPEASASAGDERALLEQALLRLPWRLRQVVVLRDVYDLSHQGDRGGAGDFGGGHQGAACREPASACGRTWACACRGRKRLTGAGAGAMPTERGCRRQCPMEPPSAPRRLLIWMTMPWPAEAPEATTQGQSQQPSSVALLRGCLPTNCRSWWTVAGARAMPWRSTCRRALPARPSWPGYRRLLRLLRSMRGEPGFVPSPELVGSTLNALRRHPSWAPPALEPWRVAALRPSGWWLWARQRCGPGPGGTRGSSPLPSERPQPRRHTGRACWPPSGAAVISSSGRGSEAGPGRRRAMKLPRAVAQFGRAPVSKTGGWGFKSLLPC